MLTITSGKLKITLTEQFCGIAGIEAGGETLLSLQPGSLFTLTAEKLSDGTTIEARSYPDFEEMTTKRDGNTTVLTCSGCEKLPNVTVVLTLTEKPEQSRIEFETEVKNRNPEYTVLTCDHPNLWFNATDDARFLSPYGCGELMKADSEAFGHGYGSTQEYPSYGVSFQFSAMWNATTRKGIYYGMHDPVPAIKQFCFLRDTGAATMRIGFAQHLENIDCPANSQKLCGKAVWQAIDGDWYDAAVIYRSWMEKNARWMPEMATYARADAHWLADIDAWLLVHIYGDKFADEIIEAAKDLGVKCAVHLYLWHQNPFDNDYPHYFPEKECVRSELKKVQDAGIKVIPYINGRLWDTHDRGSEDWQFTSVAKPFCTKDRHGKVFTESYSSKEPDGSPVVLSIMCPSTKLWQNTLKGVVGGILDDVGFDGVYMDQIAAAKPWLCADPTHDHPAGGGTWWNESYYDLIRTVADGHDPEKSVFATECTAEMFMGRIQAYLSWLWVKNDQVPAFPVVYSDKVVLFGRAYNGIKGEDSDATRIFAAQSLPFGDQMGWISPAAYNALGCKEFFKKLVHVRAELHDLLSHGVMLRPPVLSDDGPRLHSENVGHAYFKTVDYPAVQGALWQEKETGRKVLLLVNAARVAANVSLSTELPDGEYLLHGDLSGSLRVEDGRAAISLPADACVWVECR
ncbi:MAG: hypothetical protein KBS45_02890 [Clostridiales bacterium]|nr:hypothetical protein [Candidatus Coliplasma caballi]